VEWHYPDDSLREERRVAAQNGELIASGSEAVAYVGEFALPEYFVSGSYNSTVEGVIYRLRVYSIDE
jgi:hypothetical protein